MSALFTAVYERVMAEIQSTGRISAESKRLILANGLRQPFAQTLAQFGGSRIGRPT